MDFWRAVEILNRRKWLIVLSVVATTVLTFAATRLVGSKWMASVRFSAPRISPLAGNGEKPAVDDMRADPQLATYAAIIKSREVLLGAMQELNLRRLPDDLLKNIEFDRVGPRLYELHVTDASPSRAELLANALAKQ